MCDNCKYEFWLLRCEEGLKTAKTQRVRDILNDVKNYIELYKHITAPQKSMISSIRKEN